MTFEQLVIHQDTIDRLRQSVIDRRIPHAQYIQTPDGAGGLCIAIAYAQELLAGKTDMFSGADERASRLEHPDLHIVFPMVQSVDKTCDSLMGVFREYLSENPYSSYEQWLRFRGEKNKKAIISKHEAESATKKLSLRSFEGGRKVLLVWMAELMNIECANKLLKLIEEPPEGSVILMVGTDANRLLPTIRSRTQTLSLRPLENREIQQALKDRVSVIEDTLASAILNAEGSIARTLDFLEEDEEPLTGLVMVWLRLCYQRKVIESMAWCDNLAAQGREEALKVLRCALQVFREAFRKNFLTLAPGADKELDKFTDRFAPFIHADNAPEIIDETDRAISDIERNGNSRIVLLDLSFKVMKLIRIEKLETSQVG